MSSGTTTASLMALIRQMVRSVSSVGKDAAEVRGTWEDTQKFVVAQREAMGALSSWLAQLRSAQKAISQPFNRTVAQRNQPSSPCFGR